VNKNQRNFKDGNYLRGILPLLLLLVFAVIVILFIRKHSLEFEKIFHVSFFYILSISVFVLTSTCLNGFRLKILMDFFQVPLKFKEWFGLSVITTFGNYLPFQGGMLAKGAYLKCVHDFKYSSFLAMVAASYMVTFFVNGLIGLIISLLIWVVYRIFSLFIIVIFLFICLFSIFLILFSPKTYGGKKRSIKKLFNVIEGWKLIKKDYHLLGKLVIIDLIFALVYAIRLFLAFDALSSSVPLLYCLIIGPMALLSGIINLTPAAIGIREGVAGFSSKLLGMRLSSGFAATSLDRIISMMWIFALGILFSQVLLKKAALSKKQIF